jgi:hypothetical protein
MSVELDDHQYGIAWRAMVRIARGMSAEDRRLTRDELITVAREACDQLRWRYDPATAAAMENTEHS